MENVNKLFADAVEQNSNRESDWLWLVTRLTNEDQREYCWEKILHINPNCEAAKKELNNIHRRQLADQYQPDPAYTIGNLLSVMLERRAKRSFTVNSYKG